MRSWYSTHLNKILPLLVVSLLWAGPAWAQVSVPQTAQDTANPLATAGDKTVNLGGAATAGNAIIVVAYNDTTTRTITSIAGGAGDTTSYSLCKRQNTAAGGVEIWRGFASGTNPGTTITATMSSSSGIGDSFLVAIEASGLDSGVACTAHVNGASTSATTTHGSGSVTPGTAHNLIVVASMGGNRTWTFDSTPTFTNVYATGNPAAVLRQVGYLIQTSATAQSNDLTSSSTTGGELAIVAMDGTSSGAAPRQLLPLGVGAP